MRRSRPFRSVTSMSPFGRKTMLHGNASALVTMATRMRWCSAVSYTIGAVGSFLPQRPVGAIGMPPRISTFCWLSKAREPKVATRTSASVPMSASLLREIITTDLLQPTRQYRSPPRRLLRGGRRKPPQVPGQARGLVEKPLGRDGVADTRAHGELMQVLHDIGLPKGPPRDAVDSLAPEVAKPICVEQQIQHGRIRRPAARPARDGGLVDLRPPLGWRRTVRKNR